MRVTHLSLRDFRNYSVAEVRLEPGLNLILGRNGQGKTNLIEAIAYFSSLDSHRVTGDSALIRAGADSAVARMRIAVDQREALLEIQLNRDRPNRAQVNRNSVKPRELTRWFSSVVFAPEDLSIVRGEPSLRRRFLDEAVIGRNPAFSATLSDYERVVRQRSSLLKSARLSGNREAVEATLGLWNDQLVELGTRIMLERRSLVREIALPLRECYAAMVEYDHGPRAILSESVLKDQSRLDVSRETFPSGSSEAIAASVVSGETANEVDVSRETLEHQFRDALAHVRRQEIDRGMTLIGPHRDDLSLELNGLPVKGYASHGESWSFALSLRLAMANLLRKHSVAGDPVIILDDVFAELDAQRRNRLMTAVSAFEQVIVTAAVEEDVPMGAKGNRIRISSGSILPTDGEYSRSGDS